MPNLMNIRPVGAELVHVDGRADRPRDGHDEANGRFLQFFEHAQKIIEL